MLLHTGFGFLYSMYMQERNRYVDECENYNYVSDFYYLCFAQHFLACLCCQVWVSVSCYGRLYVMRAKQITHIIIKYTHEDSCIVHYDFEV